VLVRKSKPAEEQLWQGWPSSCCRTTSRLLSLWQGLTFTERPQRNLARDPAMQQLLVTKPAVGCSPEFPGRVIAALADDPDVIERSGGTFITAEVARDYGVTDIDGRVIPSLRAEHGSPIWRPVVEAVHGR
jgi:hypothetical protein